MTFNLNYSKMWVQKLVWKNGKTIIELLLQSIVQFSIKNVEVFKLKTENGKWNSLRKIKV